MVHRGRWWPFADHLFERQIWLSARSISWLFTELIVIHWLGGWRIVRRIIFVGRFLAFSWHRFVRSRFGWMYVIVLDWRFGASGRLNVRFVVRIGEVWPCRLLIVWIGEVRSGRLLVVYGGIIWRLAFVFSKAEN